MKKLLVPFLIFTMLLSGSGCSLFQKDPKDIVSEAFDNLHDVDYYSYDFSFEGDMTDGMDDMALYTFFDGIQDNSDPEQLKFTANFDVGFSGSGYDSQTVKGEIRSDDDYMYVVFDAISDFGGIFTPDVTVSFLKQWYKMDLNNETVDSMLPFYMMDEEDLTEEQKELKELVDDTDFFTNYEYVSSEGGKDLYTASLGKDDVVDFFLALADLYEFTMTDEDIEGMNAFMDSIEMEMDLYVDAAENVLVAFDGLMTINDPSGVEGSFDFSMNVDDLHQPVVVEVPENATEFDPAILLFFGAAFMEGFWGNLDPTTTETP